MSRGRALSLVVALAAAVAVGLLASSAFATGSSTKNLRSLNQEIFVAVNRFRVAHGLTALKRSPGLDRAAHSHSVEMGRRGYFAHNSADGEAFWRRIERFFPYPNVGENLLWAAPTVTAAQAMRLWIASPPHLENLETAKWRDFGVSAVSVSLAGGVYGGQRVTIVTTDFGVK
ncbi:MAG TPA: CAP domain-containing protein [Gaiellaceae bacterium]|nr:CAP domain-containing protein [Gaiellaceae bacterium]